MKNQELVNKYLRMLQANIDLLTPTHNLKYTEESEILENMQELINLLRVLSNET